MKIYDATTDGSGAARGLPACALIDNALLYAGVPWNRDDSQQVNRARRNFQPTDANLGRAMEVALSRDPEIVYLDDSQALGKVELLELAHRLRRRCGCLVGMYDQPTSADPFARNALRNEVWADRAWSDRGWGGVTWRASPTGRRLGYGDVFDVACPSIYLRPGVADATSLTAEQAWRVASAEVMLRARLQSKLPIVAFVSLDDPTFRDAPENEKRRNEVCAYMARTLRQWGVDVAVWGPRQKPLIDALLLGIQP
jgi:hypothetical protein